MNISEVFGHGVGEHSDAAWADRKSKFCRFRGGPCNKSSKSDPIGICSVSDGVNAASLCPTRFLEDGRIFRDAARLAFGINSSYAVFPEIRILQVPDAKKPGEFKKIGKVDFILGKVEGGVVSDFCAVEVQAAYFSGLETRSLLRHFMERQNFGALDTFRRPDFRSSAQKRLIPQLQLKVPVFRRWGKKFFVVVDSQFFNSLPEFRTTSQANSELTWLVYPLKRDLEIYRMDDVLTTFTEWADVETSLREGRAPDPAEIISELQLKFAPKGKASVRVFQC
ncbi:NotI family restriction endonuclease [Novosphingobium sp.]|uniref:NotI family restriction endonuclease n=1 Tax=Novosphingobium sp. TaxID=1874826 RepID=UPI0027339DD9|nr:NotI family restriction endonuclease [Novosphingobium sp.]MDP3907117.1 NotI family restriction endonuclease [Novosphingobium sp.]